MTAARLASIQRELGLTVVVHDVVGRPGSVAPRAVMAHWTATRATAARPAPTLDIVRRGVPGLPGPLYGDLVGFDGIVHMITIGRHNHAGMGSMPALDAAATGRATDGRPGPDTHGLNGLCVGVSADFHPAQGPPPTAQVDAMVLAMAARLIYHGLPAHATTDHARLTRRKIDLIEHWPPPSALRARVGQVIARHRNPAPPPATETEDDDMARLYQDSAGRIWLCSYATLTRRHVGHPDAIAELERVTGQPWRKVSDAVVAIFAVAA